MKDLFQSYHKHKVLSNLGVLAFSAVLAVSINMFALGGPNAEMLKANVREVVSSNTQSEDIVLRAGENNIALSSGNIMENISQMSFSFAYNPEGVELNNASVVMKGSQITSIENTPGFMSYIIQLEDPTSLPSNTEIMNIEITRLLPEAQFFNPVNLNFTDITEASYTLSASSLTF